MEENGLDRMKLPIDETNGAVRKNYPPSARYRVFNMREFSPRFSLKYDEPSRA
jgi:hypothetical protein